MKFQTKAIHAGQPPDPLTGAVVTPIVTATTFAQKSPGKHSGFEYSRVSTPTRKALESCIAELEDGRFALALSSGCAAMRLIAELLRPGDLILAEEDLYGGAVRLLSRLKESQGLRLEMMDFSRPDLVKSRLAADPAPKMIWIESPTNPLLKIIDIQETARQKPPGSLLIADSTFASPFFQKPLQLGADIVFHSATKYIGGHSDVLGGLIAGRSEKLREELCFLSKTTGPALSPFDSYLLLRSLKTLSLRMEAHEKNALQAAEFLSSRSKAEKVIYPGLPSHPQFETAKKQMSGFGGVLSFYIKGGGAAAEKFLKSLKIFTLAESLGAVESLAEHPLSMTHGSYGSRGVTDSLIRLSLGIEHIDDLKADLNQAFHGI